MKNLKEYINENQINESFLSVGLTIIVALILTKFTFKGIGVIKALYSAIKEGVLQGKEYLDAINELNDLLQPYKDELMKTEWGSRLFTSDGIINNDSIKSKGCAMIYMDLQDDIKATLSAEDYKKYEKIIKPIYEKEHQDTMKKFGF